MTDIVGQQKTVSLVLGSGGARGLAHIGVIRYLEEQGYNIRSVAGCSMGALVGGAYAAGKLDELEEWLCAINRSSMIGLLDMAWEKTGLVKGDKIINTLKSLIGENDIEDLVMPFTAVATDIKAGKEVWLNKGCLFDAIRASISMPLFFTPFIYNNVALIDGGVLNPVPIAPTFNDKTDLTIAVNLGGSVDERLNQKPEVEQKLASKYPELINRFIEKFSNHEGQVVSSLGAYDVASQAIDAMQETIARQKLAAYPPDKVIEIPRNVCGILEFDRGTEIINFGYSRAKMALSINF